IVTGRDLGDRLAELRVVIGAEPLEHVERAALQGVVDGCARHRDRVGAQRLEHFAGEAADAHLQALKILEAAQLLAEPAGHLAAGVAGRDRQRPAIGEQFVDELAAAAFLEPGRMLARVHAERRRGGEDEAGVLAPGVVERGVAGLRRDLASRRQLQFETPVGKVGQRLGQGLCAAVNEIERRIEARRQPPFNFWRRLCKRRGGDAGRRRRAQSCEKSSALVFHPPLVACAPGTAGPRYIHASNAALGRPIRWNRNERPSALFQRIFLSKKSATFWEYAKSGAWMAEKHMQVAAVALAGGASSRMGRPKALAPFLGQPLVARVLGRLQPQAGAVYLNASGPQYAGFRAPLVEDFARWRGAGPLAGVAAALARAAEDGFLYVATAPCDAPFLPLDLVARLMIPMRAGAAAAVAT